MWLKVICIAIAASAYYLHLCAADRGTNYFDHEIYLHEDHDSYHDHHLEVTEPLWFKTKELTTAILFFRNSDYHKIHYHHVDNRNNFHD